MTEALLCLRNVDPITGRPAGTAQYLDQATGRVYHDPEGLRLAREMVPTEFILGDKGEPIRDGHGQMIHVKSLSDAAAAHTYQNMANQYGHNVDWKMRDLSGEVSTVTQKAVMRDASGTLIRMDLAPSDVHTAATLPNYASGYRIAEGVADIVSPVVLVPKQTDVYYTWNASADFNRKIATGGAPGSAVGEVTPTLGNSQYTAVQYSLGGFITTEVQSNADTPLKPFQKMTQVVVDALLLEREYRVATLIQTSGSWNSNLVTTVAAGAQWDGGASADPIFNIHHAIEQSYLPVTGIVWSELVEHDFIRSPAVQKYFTYKDSVNGLPDPAKLSSTLRLPPIYTGKMKYLTNGGNLTYVWGNHVVFLHEPKERPPTNQMDVASAYTFRWMGGDAPDGTVTGGFLVRTYYDPKRGARGGTQIVVVHNDAELQTSALVGGLLLSAHQ